MYKKLHIRKLASAAISITHTRKCMRTCTPRSRTQRTTHKRASHNHTDAITYIFTSIWVLLGEPPWLSCNCVVRIKFNRRETLFPLHNWIAQSHRRMQRNLNKSKLQPMHKALSQPCKHIRERCTRVQRTRVHTNANTPTHQMMPIITRTIIKWRKKCNQISNLKLELLKCLYFRGALYCIHTSTHTPHVRTHSVSLHVTHSWVHFFIHRQS